MKRMNVIVDEDLLERARRVTGEKTYSATINKALEKITRQEQFWEAYREWQELARTEGIFDPEYVKEKRAKSLANPKNRVAAHEARAPREKKVTRRGSR